MRISGGIFRGRKLKTLKLKSLRPTSEKVRQAIFNIIGQDIKDRDVLDLYAGSGAFGFEALSRGASHVDFVEGDRMLCETIRENARTLGVEKSVRIIRADVESAIQRLSLTGRVFSLIFADPPYQSGVTEKLIELIDKYKILNKDGIVVIEHSKREEPGRGGRLLNKVDSRQYGDTVVTLYRRITE